MPCVSRRIEIGLDLGGIRIGDRRVAVVSVAGGAGRRVIPSYTQRQRQGGAACAGGGMGHGPPGYRLRASPGCRRSTDCCLSESDPAARRPRGPYCPTWGYTQQPAGESRTKPNTPFLQPLSDLCAFLAARVGLQQRRDMSRQAARRRHCRRARPAVASCTCSPLSSFVSTAKSTTPSDATDATALMEVSSSSRKGRSKRRSRTSHASPSISEPRPAPSSRSAAASGGRLVYSMVISRGCAAVPTWAYQTWRSGSSCRRACGPNRGYNNVSPASGHVYGLFLSIC